MRLQTIQVSLRDIYTRCIHIYTHGQRRKKIDSKTRSNDKHIMAKKILLLHGPNLNLLGTREPEKYGSVTLSQVESNAQEQVQSFDPAARLFAFQSNHEGELVDRIHQAKKENVDFIIFNAGAYTHTSIALRDAILGVQIPLIEVHITNVHAREEFRHKSYLADIAVGIICGLGPIYGYKSAVDFALNYQK